MGPDIFLAVVTTLLVVSVALNLYFLTHRHRFEAHWLSRETRALDRARAAELRAGEQIDAILERVHTAPRLDLDTSARVPTINPEARRFFADDDDPVEQAAWNEYRTGSAEDEAAT